MGGRAAQDAAAVGSGVEPMDEEEEEEEEENEKEEEKKEKAGRKIGGILEHFKKTAACAERSYE